ncbi:MAG: DUF6383 domain-containing protein [Bacteroidales bacterium]
MRNFTQSLRALALIATVLLASASAFAQTAWTEGFETAKKTEYATADLQGDMVVWNFDKALANKNSSDKAIGSNCVRIKDANGFIEMKESKANGAGTITVYHAMYGTHSGGTWDLYISQNGGDFNLVESVEGLTAELVAKNFEVNMSGDIKIKIVKMAGGSVNFDNIEITDFTGDVEVPTLTAPSSVAFGTLEVSEESTKEVSISAANLTGDLTVTIAGEGFSTEVSTITKEVAEAGTTVAVNFVGTETKDYTGTLTISGGGVEEKVITLSAEVAKLNAATIAELRTFEADNSTVYTLSGEALITFINGRNKFIEDETAAILLFDYSSGAILPAETHVAGAKVSSIQGKLTYYYGLLEFIPTAAGEVVSTGNAIPEAVVATVAEIAANYGSYEARLVKIEACELEQKTIGTGSNGNATLTQGENEMQLRNQFGQLTDFVTPDAPVDVIGYIGINTNNDGVTNRQIWPRSTADIMVATSNPSVENNYSVYGTQGNIVVNSEVSEVVSVFNITGQLVSSAVVTEGTTMLPLSKGLYIVRVGVSATKVTVE